MMTKAMVTLLGLFAEMERDFIHERTMAGKIRAREKGVKLGRKGKSKDLVDHVIVIKLKGRFNNISNFIQK